MSQLPRLEICNNEVIRLSHICLSTYNLESTCSFYCSVLGFSVVHEFINENGEKYGALIHAGNGTFLEFFKATEENKHSNETGHGHFRHFCFQVYSINKIAEKLTSAGYNVSIKHGKTDCVPQFWIKDPDGNLIEFHEYSSELQPQYKYAK